jgi:hypothetical protein
MRRASEQVASSPPTARADFLLWTALLLGPLAMSINTIVGFTVAHWTCDTNQKRFSYLVSAIDLILCIGAFVLAWSLQKQHKDADEQAPESGRRLFMSKIALLLSVISTLVVIGGTLAVMTLYPCD